MDKVQEFIGYFENTSDTHLLAIAIGVLSIFLSMILSSRIARFIEQAGFDQILQAASTAQKSTEKSLFRNICISSLYRRLISFWILAFGLSLILRLIDKDRMGIQIQSIIFPLAAVMIISLILLAAWHWMMQRIHTFVNAESVSDLINQFAGDRSNASHWNTLTELVLRTIAQALFLIVVITLVAETFGLDSVSNLLMAAIGFLARILTIILIGVIGWIAVRVLRKSGRKKQEKEQMEKSGSLNERTVEIVIIGGMASIAALSLISSPVDIFTAIFLIAAMIFFLANLHRYPDFKAGLELSTQKNKIVKTPEGKGRLTEPGVFRSTVRIGDENHEVHNSQIELAKKRTSKPKSATATIPQDPASEQIAPKTPDQTAPTAE